MFIGLGNHSLTQPQALRQPKWCSVLNISSSAKFSFFSVVYLQYLCHKQEETIYRNYYCWLNFIPKLSKSHLLEGVCFANLWETSWVIVCQSQARKEQTPSKQGEKHASTLFITAKQVNIGYRKIKCLLVLLWNDSLKSETTFVCELSCRQGPLVTLWWLFCRCERSSQLLSTLNRVLQTATDTKVLSMTLLVLNACALPILTLGLPAQLYCRSWQVRATFLGIKTAFWMSRVKLQGKWILLVCTAHLTCSLTMHQDHRTTTESQSGLVELGDL